MSIEKWVPIEGFEGRYEISNMGVIRSVARSVFTKSRGREGLRRIKSRIIKQHTWGCPYPGVALLREDGVRCRLMVHRIVAKAFIPNPLELPEVNHLDADKMNSKASNLEWCNHSENMSHAYLIGNRKTGAQHHFAALPRNEKGHCIKAIEEV